MSDTNIYMLFVVLEHMSAWVEWDANGQVNIYRYGDGGAFDLLLVEEPRILSKFEAIAVGCIVKKGIGLSCDVR